MAITVDLFTQADTLTLTDNSEGFRLIEWIQGIARRNTDGELESVQEVLRLSAEGTSHDNLASNIQHLDDFARRVTLHKNRTFGQGVDAVFLRAKLDNETGTRQSLLLHLETSLDNDLNKPPASPGNYIPGYALGLERYPLWEDGSNTSKTIGTGIDTVGGTVDYGASFTVGGDVAARPISVEFEPATSAYTLTEVWIGFKTNQFGIRGDLDPNWDLGDANADVWNNTARATGVAGAYNTQVARWTPAGGADDAMLPRCQLAMKDHVAAIDENDQCGEYIALLRCRNTVANDVFYVRLQYGLYDGTGASDNSRWITTQRIAVPGDNAADNQFYYHSMGIITIPASRMTENNPLGNYAFRIEAERTATAGGGNLELDVVTLIPAAEGAAHISDAAINDADEAIIWTDYDDFVLAETETPNGDRICNVDVYNWGLPVGDGLAVVAAQRSDRSTSTDTIDVVTIFRERWLTLRGSE
jgi:hypothetical protein